MLPKCSRKERRRGFSNRSSVDADMSEKLCVSRWKQKPFIWPFESRCIYESLRLLTIEQHNPDVITTHFMDDRFVNLGEEVILTLLWESSASESATVISLNICYWLFKCGDLRIVCVCVCVCVWARARVCERERQSHITASQWLNQKLVCTHTSIITVSLTRLFPSRAWTDGKTRTLLTASTLILKAEARDYGKERYISDGCLRCSANHNVLCQLANQGCISQKHREVDCQNDRMNHLRLADRTIIIYSRLILYLLLYYICLYYFILAVWNAALG